MGTQEPTSRLASLRERTNLEVVVELNGEKTVEEAAEEAAEVASQNGYRTTVERQKDSILLSMQSPEFLRELLGIKPRLAYQCGGSSDNCPNFGDPGAFVWTADDYELSGELGQFVEDIRFKRRSRVPHGHRRVPCYRGSGPQRDYTRP